MLNKIIARVAVVAVVFVGLVLSMPGARIRAEDPIPDKVRAELEGIVKKKATDLLAEKNQEGRAFKRGNYSRNFRRVDDGTYQSAFQVDTVKSGQMITERFLLTLKKDPAGRWAIADQQLKDTYDGLYRGVLGDEEFYRFDRFAFDREGLKVTATNGFVMKDFLNGKTSRFILAAGDLAYEYSPPTDLMDFYQVHKSVLLKKYAADAVFGPKYVRIECVAPSCEELEGSTFTNLRKVALAETDGSFQSVYGAIKRDAEEFFRDNAFSGFRPLYAQDRRTYNLAIRKDSPKEIWVWMDYDNWAPWEISVGGTQSDQSGPIFSYYSEDTRKSGASPYDLEKRDDLEAKDYELDTLTGTVSVAVEDPEAISGDVTYGMTIKRDLRELQFRIARVRRPGEDTTEAKNPKLFINSIQDEKGNDLTWVKTGAYTGIVAFPKLLPAGAKVTLRMQFTNLDSIYKLNPSYSYVDRGGWLPFVRFSDMIDSFDLTVKVPAKYRTLSVGRKASDQVQGDVRVTRWVSEKPMNFPTVIFGDYVDDGPGVTAMKLDGTEIPVRVYVDKMSTQTLDTKMLETQRGTEEDARDLSEALSSGQRGIRQGQLRAVADQAANSLNIYRAVYDVDYPFGKLDLVCDPVGSFYGQSPASIVYLGYGVFRGEGFVAGSALFGRAGAGISRFNKDVVAHEVAHQWWGGTIANANDRNYWFVESLAELSSALYVEAVNESQSKNGRKKYLEKVAEWRRNILEAEIITSVQNASTLWGGSNPGQAYVANVYNKGPYAFHILRETFGDEKFFQFLKTLAKEREGQEIVTRDIQAAMEKSYGGTMDWFFDQWIRGIGIPQYALSYTVRKTEDGKWLVEGKVRQRVLFGPDKTEMKGVYYRAVAPLTFLTQGGKELRSKPLLVQGAETPFQMKVAEEPVEVAFNKQGEILAHDVLVNRSW